MTRVAEEFRESHPLRKSRRRTRRVDPLASPEAVRRILGQLYRQCPENLPKSERLVVKMLESVRHYERRPKVNESRGRPRRWLREDVSVVAEKLRKVLERKTSGRVSPASFVSLYLRLLRYPADVIDALREGEINVREAEYLSRITPGRLKSTHHQARHVRAELLKAHVLTKGSQRSLQLRVKAILGELPEEKKRPGKTGKQKADDLLLQNPYDARHLFYEEIQLLINAMQQVEPNDLKGKTLSEFLRQMDKMLGMLRRVKGNIPMQSALLRRV